MYYNVDFDCDFVTFRWDEAKSDADNYKVVDHPLKREDCLIMQYSDILDCNGEKVWEGDIIHFEHDAENDEGVDVLTSWYYEVTFYRGAFVMLNQNGVGDPLINLGCTNPSDTITANVVGNVFEHVHLLELSADYVHTPQLVVCHD